MMVLGVAWAQNAGEGGSMPQLPVGQTFKQFQFPIYQEGKLKATLEATEARGITLNRAETTDLKIEIYDNGAVTTTVSSPKADLYVTEQKMRTKNTVQIVRTDMEATSRDCDFDLKTKKYLLRTNVKVVLKHFDLNPTPAHAVARPAASNPAKPVEASPSAPLPTGSDKSLLETPGSNADTNSAPLPPPSSPSSDIK